MVTFENAQYSVPAHLLGARVFVRTHGTGPGEQVIIVHPGAAGPVEVARHDRARPGSPAINDEHFPGSRTRIPGDYEVRARSADEAAAAGTARMNVKMAEAVTLAKTAGTDQVDRALEWITRRENLVGCGPSGTGKTFFLEALGQQAVEAGMRVAWFRLEDLGVLIRAHRTDDSVTRAVARILRAELVVIDDIGLLPVATDAAEGLYRVVDAAYEKRSVAISSNLHPAGFDELMPKTLATATVDRLLHHAHVCQTSGDSVRLTQALAGKGVTRLN